MRRTLVVLLGVVVLATVFLGSFLAQRGRREVLEDARLELAWQTCAQAVRERNPAAQVQPRSKGATVTKSGLRYEVVVLVTEPVERQQRVRCSVRELSPGTHDLVSLTTAS